MAKKLLELLLHAGYPCLYAATQGRSSPQRLSSTSVNSDDRLWPLRPSKGSRGSREAGGWIHETLVELCKNWPRRWDEYVQPAFWLHWTTPDPRLPGKATPFLLFGRDCRTQMVATSPSPDDEGMDGLRNLIADKSENLRQVQEVRKDLQHRHEQ